MNVSAAAENLLLRPFVFLLFLLLSVAAVKNLLNT